MASLSAPAHGGSSAEGVVLSPLFNDSKETSQCLLSTRHNASCWCLGALPVPSLILKATLGHAEMVSDGLRMCFQGDAGWGQ